MGSNHRARTLAIHIEIADEELLARTLHMFAIVRVDGAGQAERGKRRADGAN